MNVAKKLQPFLFENVINVLVWPAQRPDLDLIGHL